MRRHFIFLALAISDSAFGAEHDAGRVRKQLTSDNYTVVWGTAPTYDPAAELEIGDGSGHGGALRWMRFQPRLEGVNVLSIELDKDTLPYGSKWPPDRASVVVKRATLKPAAYAALLRDLAVIDAAKLKPIQQPSSWSSSRDFWVYARLAASKKTFVGLDWAGYNGSAAEVKAAKPQAVVTLAQEAVQGLDFEQHALSDEERKWASTKFARDWKKFKDLTSHWWVRERYIITIGVIGDVAAVPTLRGILAGDPKDRSVYYAINAITRLTRKDVRDKPVEEMDVEKTRDKIFDLLRGGK